MSQQSQNPMAVEPVPRLMARIGTGVGTNALLGQGDREQANRTVGNAQLLAVCITGVFMLFAAFDVRDAITPIVSFNFGMRSRARVQQDIRWGLGCTAGLMLVGCVGVELFAEPLAIGEVVTLGVAAALYYRNGKKLVAAL